LRAAGDVDEHQLRLQRLSLVLARDTTARWPRVGRDLGSRDEDPQRSTAKALGERRRGREQSEEGEGRESFHGFLGDSI